MSLRLVLQRAAFRYAESTAPVGPFEIEVQPGEMHAVVGPSGCGKSTVARMLGGAIPHLYHGHLSGRILVGPFDAASTPLWQLCREAALVAQNPAGRLLGATVSEELRFGLETLGLGETGVRSRVDWAMRTFDLASLGSRGPDRLSGGEQQLLLLAAAAARSPRALVLDEPCSMLDAVSRARVVAGLLQLREMGTTLVVHEHQPWPTGLKPDVIHSLAAAGSPELANPPSFVPADAWRKTVEPFDVTLDALTVRLARRPILDGLDLSARSGRVVAVTGRNASGKTTLLRYLAGLQPADSGVRRESRRLRWGMSFQNPDRQFFNPTARAEVGLGGAEPGVVEFVLAALGLDRLAEQAPLLLSEGQKKRLALAILLASPGLDAVCLDEPTVGQDALHRRIVGQLVRRLAARGMLCLVATHDLDWAARWADEAVLLHEGRIDARVPASALVNAPQAWVRAGLCAPRPTQKPGALGVDPAWGGGAPCGSVGIPA